MFLSNRGVARQRIGRPLAGTRLRANCPHGSTVSSSLTHGCSFRCEATPEQLPSPKRPPVGPTAAPPHRQALSLCLWVWVALGFTRDGVGLSPVSVDSHCVQARPPITP